MKYVKFENIIFVIAFSISFYFISFGWNELLLDQHSFRQTQTAITTYYLKKEGFRLDYITPVFGQPWTIPFEFPTYQIIVALVSEITNFSLESCGRFINLIFFYTSFIFIYTLLKNLQLKNSLILLIFSFILLSPIYIFWSRTFMIESTAMFFGIATSSLFISYIVSNKRQYLFFAVLTGVLAALTKITTFISFGFFSGLLLLYFFSEDKNVKIFLQRCLKLFFISIIAIIIGYIWVKYTDQLKNLNPLSIFINSNNLTRWNFGSLEQRLSFETWRHIIFDHLKQNLGYTFLFGLSIFLVTFYCKINKLALVFLSAFLVTLLLFTNLFYVHNYYFYSIALFAIIFVVLIIDSLDISLNIKRVIVLLLLLLQVNGYKKDYYKSQTQLSENNKAFDIGYEINKNLQDDTFIIVYGDDWNSRIPYYSMRKAIMLRDDVSQSDFIKSIEKSGGINKFNALIIKFDKVDEFRKKYLDTNKYDYKEAYKIGDYVIFYSKNITIEIPYSLEKMLHNTISPIKPEIKFYKGEWILFAHMQSMSILPMEISDSEKIYNFSYGIEEIAYSNNGKIDGGCFEIYSIKETDENSKLIWNNCLYPLIKILDRGIISSKIIVPKNTSKLYLYTKAIPGKSTDYGWTFWGNFSVQQ